MDALAQAMNLPAIGLVAAAIFSLAMVGRERRRTRQTRCTRDRLHRIRTRLGDGCSPEDAVRLSAEAAGQLTTVGPLPHLTLQGVPYQRGLAHGFLLRNSVRAQYATFLDRIASEACVLAVTWVWRGPSTKPGALERAIAKALDLPGLREVIRDRLLDTAWKRLAPHLPTAYAEELEGIADGAGVELAAVHRFHAVSEVASAGCSNLAAWGAATEDGKFLQYRNLDWSLDLGVQDHPLLLTVRGDGDHLDHLTAGFAGFAGALQGINRAGITLGEVGAGSSLVRYDGQPMVFRLRRILERASDLDGAEALMRESNRTKGYNFVIGAVRDKWARIFETNSERVAAFEPSDIREDDCAYARPTLDAALRGDAAVDSQIRRQQHAANGPGDPRGSYSHEYRYLLVSEMLESAYGDLDVAGITEIARASGRRSRNLVSVVYTAEGMRVAYATGAIRACDRDYVEVPWVLEA